MIVADEWFEFSGTAPEPTLICSRYNDPNGAAQSRAGKMVIDGTFEPYKGYPASTWEASLGAFSVLMAHPELRPAGSPDAAFYNLHDTGNVGKLQRAREARDNIALFSASLESAWTNNETAVSQKLDEIRAQNQEMQQAQTPAQQAQIAQMLTTLKGELTALQQTNQSLSAQYLSAVADRANLLLSDLAAISTTDVWESNLKTVLTLLAQRQLAGNAEWTEAQQNTLQAIADQCRHAGGIGVVIARAAIEKFDYDDEALCPGFTQPRSGDATGSFNATLVPNPANDICHVVFGRAASGTLTLSDLQGRVLRYVRLTDVGSFDLDTRDLTIGLYYVQVKSEQGIVCSNKLAVSH
ncbi:MAG: T9SS type A sorting domain-containing protein [Saprospiraceae bacterium]